MRVILKTVLGLGVLGCIGASCFFAFEFGMTRGTTPMLSWGFALLALFLDLLKSGLPLLAHESDSRAYKAGAWVSFVFLTFMSLWCAYGMNATQIAERTADRAAAESDRRTKKEALDRATAERKALPDFRRTTAAALDAAQKAVEAAARQAAAECGEGRGGRGPNCRNREEDERAARAALVEAETHKANTDKADELDAKISEAEKALASVDVRKAERVVDPLAESMAKVLRVETDTVALISMVIFAIGVEVGSGLGFWLVFGHGRRNSAPAPKPAPEAAPEPEQAAAPAATVSPRMLSLESRDRFFKEAVFHQHGSNVPSGLVYGAYLAWFDQDAWCRDNGARPMDSVAFGIKAPWFGRKRIGGVPHYLDCGIGAAFAPKPRLALAVSN